MSYLTKEQYEVISGVHDEHEDEFRQWAEDNEEYLMGWYDRNPGLGMFEGAAKFAYYCASEFNEYRINKIEG